MSQRCVYISAFFPFGPKGDGSHFGLNVSRHQWDV